MAKGFKLPPSKDSESIFHQQPCEGFEVGARRRNDQGRETLSSNGTMIYIRKGYIADDMAFSQITDHNEVTIAASNKHLLL